MLLAQSLLASQKFEDRYYEFTTTSNTINYFPQVRPYGGSVTIDWGDGNIEVGLDCSTSAPAYKEYQHTYSVAGSYTVRISTERNASFSIYCGSNTYFDTSTLSVTGSTKQRGRSWDNAFLDMTETAVNGMPNVNTEHVTDMSSTFEDANNITSLPAYDTRNVTDFSSVFKGCGALIDFPAIDTSSATDMAEMFQNCASLNSSSPPTYNCSNVTTAARMFEDCVDLTLIPTLTNLSPSNTRGYDYFANGCTSLTTAPTFDLSNVISVRGMFANCTSLASFPFTSLPSHITDITSLCHGLTQFTTFPSLDISNATNGSQLFSYLTQNFTVPNWDYSNLTSIRNFFWHSSGLTNANMPSASTLNINWSNISDASNFFGYSGITACPNWDFSSLTTTDSMFEGCASLTTLPSTLNFSNSTNAQGMFDDCISLAAIPALDFSSVVEGRSIFQGCTSLVTFPSGITFDSLTRTSQMFYGCSSLANFPAGVFDTTGNFGPGVYHLFTFQGCALTPQSIENILVSLNTNSVAIPRLDLGGGTNAGMSTWSTAALAAWNSLRSNGTQTWENP